MRANAAVVVSALLCLGAGFASATEIDTSVDRLHPLAVDSGGQAGMNFTSYRLNSTVGEPMVRTVSFAGSRIFPGEMNLESFPGTVVNLATASFSTGAITWTWSSPGYDGEVGAFQPGTTYFIQLSSVPPASWALASAGVKLSTRTVIPGTTSFYTASGLMSNTTYYMGLWTLDAAGDASFVSNPSTTATLASAPKPDLPAVLEVAADSATLRWAALAVAPSSMSSEGYLLQASTAANFSGVVYSSQTANVLLSTLAVSGLAFNATYYFRVGALNWSGTPDFSALPPLDFRITISTGLINFGTMDPFVARSTVSVSSMVVVNVGNWPATIELRASTATLPSSPWILSTSSGVETVVLWGLWNSVQPLATAFSTYLTTNTVISQVGGNYAGNQNGVSILPGQSRTLWFRFWLPTTTATLVPQVLAVTPQGVYP